MYYVSEKKERKKKERKKERKNIASKQQPVLQRSWIRKQGFSMVIFTLCI